MALTTCPDCGNQVSTHAIACPKCGWPATAVTEPPVLSAAELVSELTSAQSGNGTTGRPNMPRTHGRPAPTVTTPSPRIDRAAIRAMVEEQWRSMRAAQGDQRALDDTLSRIRQNIEAAAASMPPDTAAAFFKALEEERDIQFAQIERKVATAETVGVDRASVRAMCEDHYRLMISVARNTGNQQECLNTIRRFDQRIQTTAESMEPHSAAAFLKAVDEERTVLADEHERDPNGLKQRLGLGAFVDGQPSRSNGLAELAVRTAVRATVWDTVRMLFRFLR